MSDLLTHLPAVVGLLLITFVGPLIAFGALWIRKCRARQLRRSPIGIDLLRGPGHSLREQIEEHHIDLISEVSTLMVMPLVMVALFLAQAQRLTLERMWKFVPLFVIFVVGFLIFQIWRLVKAGSRLDNLRAGYDAEVAVGQELDQLMRQGAAVFHDFPGEGFNIDHVVVSRRGLFAVETKGYTKSQAKQGRDGARVVFDGLSLSFPTWTSREPLEQAERQAKWLSRWATSATGETIEALPVVALPGWFIERKGRGPVRVYSGRELVQLLEAVATKPLSAESIQRVAHQVEQRCRDVRTRYSNPRAAGR